jgi:hypothetical protein
VLKGDRSNARYRRWGFDDQNAACRITMARGARGGMRWRPRETFHQRIWLSQILFGMQVQIGMLDSRRLQRREGRVARGHEGCVKQRKPNLSLLAFLHGPL